MARGSAPVRSRRPGASIMAVDLGSVQIALGLIAFGTALASNFRTKRYSWPNRPQLGRNARKREEGPSPVRSAGSQPCRATGPTDTRTHTPGHRGCQGGGVARGKNARSTFNELKALLKPRRNLSVCFHSAQAREADLHHLDEQYHQTAACPSRNNGWAPAGRKAWGERYWIKGRPDLRNREK